MTQLWTITDIASGAVLAACFATDSFGQHPKDSGWEWDAATQRATRIDGPVDEASQEWTGTGWEPDVAKVAALLTAQIDAERYAALAAISPPMLAEEYAAKAVEMAAWSPESDPEDFPFLNEEAILTGTPLAGVVQNASDARAASVALRKVISAKAIAAKQTIMASVDPTSMRAAADGWAD